MPNINSRAAISSACLMSAASASVYLMLPLLIGAMVTTLGLTESQAGLTSAAFFLGYTLICLSAWLWIRRVDWRLLALAGYTLLAGGMLAIGQMQQQFALVACMFVAGVGAGVLLGLGITMIADMRHGDRIFGLQMVAEQLLPAAMIIALPLVLPDADFKAICGFMGLVFALLGTTVWLTPAKGITRDGSAAGGKLSPLATRSSLLALVVIALYFGGFSGVWAFSERLADSQQLAPRLINIVLACALLGGAVGGGLTAALAERYSRARLLTVATLVSLGVVASYALEFHFWLFALGTFVFLLAWNIATPCQQSLVAALDKSGRIVVILPAAFALGALFGPALAGWLAETWGYNSLLAVCGAISALCLLPLLMLDQTSRRGQTG